MKIYIVIGTWKYEGSNNLSAHSSMGLAEIAKATYEVSNNDNYDSYSIQEMTVD